MSASSSSYTGGRATIIELISATATTTGLKPPTTPTGSTGVKITDVELAAVPLVPHDFHGEWNYTINAQSVQA